MHVRRVVTGHDANGKAVFVSDQDVTPAAPSLLAGMEFHRLWGGDGIAHFPDAGTMPAHHSYFPPIGGFRFGMFSVPPDGGAGVPADLDVEAALAELEGEVPGLVQYVEADNPGMHTTATIDFGVVLSGTAILELDDGVKVALGVGDTYIQNGTRHRWSNTGDQPAVLAVALVGAEHRNVGI